MLSAISEVHFPRLKRIKKGLAFHLPSPLPVILSIFADLKLPPPGFGPSTRLMLFQGGFLTFQVASSGKTSQERVVAKEEKRRL